jgi:hypothetical protein
MRKTITPELIDASELDERGKVVLKGFMDVFPGCTIELRPIAEQGKRQDCLIPACDRPNTPSKAPINNKENLSNGYAEPFARRRLASKKVTR